MAFSKVLKADQPQKQLQTYNKISVEKLKGAVCMFVVKVATAITFNHSVGYSLDAHPATTSATRTELFNYREYLIYLSVPTFSSQAGENEQIQHRSSYSQPSPSFKGFFYSEHCVVSIFVSMYLGIITMDFRFGV